VCPQEKDDSTFAMLISMKRPIAPLTCGSSALLGELAGPFEESRGMAGPYDVWITPVLATPPMKIGTVDLEGTDLMKG
jgi:hypothetical protein